MKVDLYNLQGKKTGQKISLKDEVFAVEADPDLIHQAVVAELANKRRATASTKKRGEVQGGGAKPWPQKGTGRARAGSIRSPIWRGGGVVFGPTSEISYKKKIPHKAKVKAILAALSSKIKENKLIILKELKLKEIKTKAMVEILGRLPIEGKILLLIGQKDKKILRSTKNLPYLKILISPHLNILDLIKYDFLVLTKKAKELIETQYGNK